MNQKFTEKVQAWLAQDAEQRDYAQGALLLLQLTGNQIMYRNLMVNPKRRAEFIEYQLKKRLSYRLNQVTHEQVEAMQAEVDKIVVNRNLEVNQDKPVNEFKAGKRADHDQLPDEIQALYVENLGIVQKMRELHLKLRSLSLENATCPDSERYPFRAATHRRCPRGEQEGSPSDQPCQGTLPQESHRGTEGSDPRLVCQSH